MDELVDNPFDISELILLLQHEKQLVFAERKQIQDLNQSLYTKIEQLLKSGWINFQQRLNLNSLVGSRPDCTPEQCCRKATSLENSTFIQAKDIFDYQVTVNFSHFLSWLRSRPELIAQLVVIGEALSTDQKAFTRFLNSIVSGLYGSIVLPQDTELMLTLLQNLAQLQLAATDNPRRLLKTQSCAFSKMYFLFHEGLVSAKLFLIAALQNPIIKLIARSACYLDVDPAKILSRLSLSERLEKFGPEGSEEYNRKLNQHRKSVIKSLAELTHLFISSLHDNIYCFPSTLTWLIRKVAMMISKAFNPHSKEINAICTDLIFTLFICPAIIQPEPYGICDAPISDIARHNLIQVGQILQMLALLKFETPELKLLDLYSMFEADCVSNILDIIMGIYGDLMDEMPLEKVQGIERNIALFTEEELYELVGFLKRVHNSTMDQCNTGNEAASVDFCSNNANSLPNDPLQILLSKLPSDNEGSPRNTLNNNNNISPTNASKKIQLLNKAKTHLSRLPNNGDCDELPRNTTVLIIPLNSENEEHIGLLTEEKVLSMHISVDQDLLIDITDAPIIDPPELVNGGLTSGQEKRTRFSLNDEGSIGNTSDNLEVISEAASNHSVASSIELENEDQNDNLSDMVSANVSGRGTPNISGRDTPSSQVTENEDNRVNPEVRPPYLQQPQLVSKQIRSEIDDKFCKFEIKKLLEGDETISIISDTWSTDVLASDSETIDAGDGRHEQIFTPIISNPLLDVSETQSESAWSTDVLASDTERLTEVDNDDIASVAPSDDTASVARSDDAASVAPSELDENLNDRRLSTASSTNHFVNFQASQNNSPSAFQEYRRIDVGIRRESMPNYSLSKQEMHSETQAQNSSFERAIVYNTNDTQLLRATSRSCSDSTKREAMIIDQKCDFSEKQTVVVDISNNIDSPGSSGLNSSTEASYVLVKKVEQNKYDDIKTDMQLSNTSLNSSSSESSLENKPGAASWKIKESWNGSETNLNVTSSTPLENKKMVAKSKPSVSTGAIPKSISFDMSAEKGDKEVDDDQKSKRGGFFGKLRMNFRPRRGKTYRSDESNNSSRVDGDDENKFRRPYDYNTNSKTTPIISLADTSDDILAKYRKPIQNGPIKVEKIENIEDVQLMISEGVDLNLLFKDAKKKLRLVLSNARSQHYLIKKGNKAHIKKDLESFLQLELAKARDLRNYMTAARVAEALRCVRLLDISTFNKLCQSLKDDYYDRSIYIKYLLKSKQALLLSQAYLDELLDQGERDKDLCATFLVAVCVRFFLERHERDVQIFCEEFQRFTLVDEQNHHLNLFLTNFFIILRKDQLWQDSSDEQIHMAKEAVERAVMTQVYFQALFPNGDGDRHRDSVLSEHLKKLASTITPGNKYLLINKIYHNECPWLPAQEALQAMAAYRTPRDKVQCIIRCTCAIMDLLSLAQRNSTTADDLIPVLVYVIIEANPQDLLSTIQYVNSFYGNLSGEDRYWWTQFCSAVEYTKTMEYND